MAHARVQLRQQFRHLERFGIEGAPDATEIVANIFAEADGVGAVVLVCVRGLDVAATDGDDGGGGPVLLDLAGGPEELEEPLWMVVVSIVIHRDVGSGISPQDPNGFAARQAAR